MEKYRVAIIDGQGGGIGKALVSRIRQEDLPIELIALGTNSAATAQMMKAGANHGATGENAICFQAGRVHFILGVVAILSANSLFGELSPTMANAIGTSDALKILLPLNRCDILVTCSDQVQLSDHIEHAIYLLKKEISNKQTQN